MKEKMKFLEIIFLLTVFCISFNKAEVYSTHICEGKIFEVQCPENEVLAFDHANYGRTNFHTCGGVSDEAQTHCILPDTVAELNMKCFGKSTCSIPVNDDTFQNRCPGMAKYLNVTYSCVQESDITEACVKYMAKIKDKSQGYIKSYRYPALYQEQSDCVVKLKPRAGYKYDLTLLDLDVQNREGVGCYDWLIVKDEENALKHFNLCGKYPHVHTYEPIKMQQLDNVAVIFRSDAFADRNRGFIIKYEEVKEIPLHKEL